jgi:UDP-N-acetylmuramoylalanine--D-glutamate ligase
MKIAILGFGREGKAVLKFLKKSAQYKNAEISILDKKTDKNYLKNLTQFDIIFRSPGIPYNLPEIQNTIKKGVKFSSATQLFFEKFKGKVIGITGTKGKGTTSTLLYKILKSAGKDARPEQRRRIFLAGNIGKPAVELLPKLKNNSIVILELSSFQLQDLKHSPNIAVVLNIFEDHLDSHKNFNEYINSKANIAKWQKKSDKIFYDASNKQSKWIAEKSQGKKIPVQIYPNRDLKIVGEHNLKNVAMAATVAQSLGIKPDIIKKVVKNYRGMEHRLELVHSNILENVGMNFYNDSASTNPYTAAAAIRAFPNQPKILICGGKDKNLDYTPLAKALKNSDTKIVILFGENKQKIAKAISEIKNSGLRIMEVKNLKQAVQLAYKTAKKLISLSAYQLITIIFSPAAASFDMFKDYKDRGEKFKEIVKGLK